MPKKSPQNQAVNFISHLLQIIKKPYFIVALLLIVFLIISKISDIAVLKDASVGLINDWQYQVPMNKMSTRPSFSLGQIILIPIVIVFLLTLAYFLFYPLIVLIRLFIFKLKKIQAQAVSSKFNAIISLSIYVIATLLILSGITGQVFFFLPLLIIVPAVFIYAIVNLINIIKKQQLIKKNLLPKEKLLWQFVPNVLVLIMYLSTSLLISHIFRVISGMEIAKIGSSTFNSTPPGIFDTGGISMKSVGGMDMAMMQSENIGFSTGGAKDINNFRENIKNGYLPMLADMTYEGLFYDYYFDTGKLTVCQKLFCPSYTTAVSPDPFSGQNEYFLTVGLNSGIKESDFKRKKLNLVVVMDISGSMSSGFDSYYYDNQNNESSDNKSKMQVANESVVAMLDHLNQNDRFGMVLYDDDAYLAKPLNLVGKTDMAVIKSEILKITPQGSTNMEAGLKMASEMLSRYKNSDSDEYENRIIFLTDAMPNTGDYSETGLLGMTTKNADNKTYLTFIGIGVDFNSELVEALTKVRGANYYSVHSSSEFKTRLADEFEYMVTPLVFNLSLQLETQGFEIKNVYGSPEADLATGQIMQVNTLFPSKTEGGETKGGVILLKLKKIADNPIITLKTSYEDRQGKVDGDTQTIVFNSYDFEYFDNTGIQKAILLSRYLNLVKNWAIDERRATVMESSEFPESVNQEMGIVEPSIDFNSEWERSSTPLTISGNYRQYFASFAAYFDTQKNLIGDQDLTKELTILDKLSKD